MSWWSRRRPMRCDDFVELVTEYLDDASRTTTAPASNGTCAAATGCTRVLAQWREVIRITGHIDDTHVDRLDDGVRASSWPRSSPPTARPEVTRQLTLSACAR